jgi:hypothetical protein
MCHMHLTPLTAAVTCSTPCGHRHAAPRPFGRVRVDRAGGARRDGKGGGERSIRSAPEASAGQRRERAQLQQLTGGGLRVHACGAQPCMLHVPRTLSAATWHKRQPRVWRVPWHPAVGQRRESQPPRVPLQRALSCTPGCAAWPVAACVGLLAWSACMATCAMRPLSLYSEPTAASHRAAWSAVARPVAACMECMHACGIPLPSRCRECSSRLFLAACIALLW